MRDTLDELRAANVAAIGISPDSPAAQLKFDNKHNLGFPLLSDRDHRIAEAFGVWAEKKMYGKTHMGIVRSSFLIAGDGTVSHTWYKISPKNTVPELLKALAEL